MDLENITLVWKFYKQEIQSHLQVYSIHRYAGKHRVKLKCPIKKLQIDPVLKSNNHSQKDKEN